MKVAAKFNQRISFPRLYAKNQAGRQKWWEVIAEETDDGAQIIVRYGLIGQEEEKTQQTIRKVESGKNLGRSNETTAFEQARNEAESLWEKKLDKKYTPDPEVEAQILLPMLAHDYSKHASKIEYSCFVQPKLNGVRCLARKVSPGKIEFISRGGKRFETMGHLVPYLDEVMEVGAVLDGELFNRNMTFQQIVSAIKRNKTENPLTKDIEYWVYDVVGQDVPYHKRYEILREALPAEGSSPVSLLRSHEAADQDEVRSYHQAFVAEGFEGTIIRNKGGVYRTDYRSYDLQKYKDFIDEEFVIVGGKEGTGRAEGTITFTCITEEGKHFDVRPRGTEEQRRYWWEHLAEYIGKKLTVRYQYRSEDNIPIFPVAIELRDYEG